MNKKNELINNIKSSNLSDIDKQRTIEILSKKNIDIDSLVLAILKVLELGTSIYNIFEIDNNK